MNKQEVIDELAPLLKSAARASVAAGAVYEPKEPMSKDTDGAWRAVAGSVYNLIEKMIEEKLDGEAAELQG